MINIDFFGCSFTQNTKDNYRVERPISIREYSEHTHITKVQSNFLEFDLAYNQNTEYQINNFGRGSYGNFTIGSVIENRIPKLNKEDNNIAIVQLSALLRNEDSLNGIIERKDNITPFVFEYDKIKSDYIVDDVDINAFYSKHVSNIENIYRNISSNYTKFLIYFGWDITTKEFIELFKQSNVYDKIVTFDYDYDLSEIKYFGNWENFNNGRYKGQYGGLLEYASNHLVEEIRYCSETDQHPSYFSNKVFYKDILRNFIREESNLDLSKSIFEDSDIKEYENFLVSLIAGKYKNGFYKDYSYQELYKLIDNWLIEKKLKFNKII